MVNLCSNSRRVHNLSSFSEDGEPSDIIWALKDVSFQINRGEVVGVIGKNGAGKSTLLKILSRIAEPTSGEAFVNGNIASLLEVGTGFHSELTGRENLYLNGALLGMKREEIDRKFDEIINFSGIDRFIDTPVKRYSSGMYVRLAFSIAAYLEPDILLIDEVLAVGDIEFQRKCLGKMDEVAAEGRTVLFVSHNMGSVGRLCKSAILIEDGRVIKQDDANEVINHYVASSINNVNSNPSVSFPHVEGKKAYIKTICLRDSQGNENSVFDQLKPFQVEMSYCVNEPCIIYAGITIKTLDETVRIANSRETENEDFELIEKKIGEYKTSLEFPGGILNSGYFCARMVIMSMGIVYDVKPSPAFELIDYGSIGNFQTTSRPGKRGLLTLNLKWESIKI